MRTRTHAFVTFGATAVALGLLIGLPDSVTSTATVSDSETTVSDAAAIVAPARDGIPLGTWEGYTGSHCVATVDEGLDWYSEGRTGALPDDETSILYGACDVLGQASEAYIWEDGSWRVTATVEHDGPEGLILPGVYWRGCFSVGSCMP